MTENNGACETCGESFDNDDFGTDGDGYLVSIHVCNRIAIERLSTPLPRYEQTARFGLMQCERCPKVIQRRRPNQRTCLECGAIVRKEQDAERWRARRGAA